MRNVIMGLALIFTVSLTACGGRYRTTTIEMNNGSESVRIKSSGQVRFNPETTAIQSIAPGGYLSYRRNNKKLTAESNEQGQLTIEMSNDGKALILDAEGKHFMADAIKDMLAQGFQP